MSTRIISDIVVLRESERKLYRFTFDDQPEIVRGEVIVGVQTLDSEPGTIQLTLSSFTNDSVDFWAEGGVADGVYAVRVLVLTDAGSRISHTGGIRVVEP